MHSLRMSPSLLLGLHDKIRCNMTSCPGAKDRHRQFRNMREARLMNNPIYRLT